MGIPIRIKLDFILDIEGNALPTVDICTLINFGTDRAIPDATRIHPGARIRIARVGRMPRSKP